MGRGRRPGNEEHRGKKVSKHGLSFVEKHAPDYAVGNDNAAAGQPESWEGTGMTSLFGPKRVQSGGSKSLPELVELRRGSNP